MNNDALTLAVWITASPSTVLFDGAGMSTEPGIPDFHRANGFYFQERKILFETVLSVDFFERHPQACWEWFHEIYHPVKPSGAYRTLASPEIAGRLDAVITQNIDGLHQRAGSRTAWKLHGNWERFVCTSREATASLGDSIRVDGSPASACPPCVSQMRPDIVIYDESLNQDVIEAAVIAISRASVLIVTGTFLVVYPAAGPVNYFSGNHLVLMNATPTSADAHVDLIIRKPMGAIPDRVMDKLRAQDIIPAWGLRRTGVPHRPRPRRTDAPSSAHMRVGHP